MTLSDCPSPAPSDTANLRHVQRWNRGVGWWAVFVTAGWFFWADAPTLIDRSGYGSIRMWVAETGYALIAIRAVTALVLRDRSLAWVPYAVLLLAVGPLVVALTHLAGGP